VEKGEGGEREGAAKKREGRWRREKGRRGGGPGKERDG